MVTEVAVLVTTIVVVTVSATSTVDADAVTVFAGPVVVVVVHTSVVPVLRDAVSAHPAQPSPASLEALTRGTPPWTASGVCPPCALLPRACPGSCTRSSLCLLSSAFLSVMFFPGLLLTVRLAGEDFYHGSPACALDPTGVAESGRWDVRGRRGDGCRARATRRRCGGDFNCISSSISLPPLDGCMHVVRTRDGSRGDGCRRIGRLCHG